MRTVQALSVPVTTLTACLLSVCASAQVPDAPPASVAPPDTQITITSKDNKRSLEQVIVPHFVASHGEPTLAIEQITRWRDLVCPSVTGLAAAFNEAVAHRIESTAQSIGAKTATTGRNCDPKQVNIEVIFTSTPQALLDNIDTKNPWLLGSARRPNDTRISRAVQVWYTTGSRAIEPQQMPKMPYARDAGASTANPTQQELLPAEYPSSVSGKPGVIPDAPYAGATANGLAGSHLTEQLRSELLNVLVIVDTRNLHAVPLEAVTDYIALVSLTRITSLDTCNALSSILDLLSTSCSERQRPTALTQADAAFLRALYSSELDKKLNVEQGEVRDRMIAILLNKP
jgi:hypothetical protein